MANTIRIKRRPSSGSAGSPSAASLYNGELAFNENDNTLYYAYGSGVGGVAASVPAIGGSGAYSLRGGTNASGTWPISVNGNSASVTNGVYTTGEQTVGGQKRFSASPIVSGNLAGQLIFQSANAVNGGHIIFDGVNLGSETSYIKSSTSGIDITHGTKIQLNSALEVVAANTSSNSLGYFAVFDSNPASSLTTLKSVSKDQILDDIGAATSGLDITAGSGLLGGGTLSQDRRFDIGQGDGISVSADSIAVDSTVVRTTGTQSIGGAKTFGDGLTVGNNVGNFLAGTSGVRFTHPQINFQIDAGNLNPGFDGDALRLDIDSENGTGYVTTLKSNAPVQNIIVRLPNTSGTLALDKRDMIAGSGLVGGGNLSADRTFDINTGDGIQIVSDAVAVNSTVVRTTGTQTVAGVKTLSNRPVLNSGLSVLMTSTASSGLFFPVFTNDPSSAAEVLAHRTPSQVKGDIGLSNVTNDAQIKKLASTSGGFVPTWNGTTGDVLNIGYSVETTLTGGAGALPRADAVKTYVDSAITSGIATNDAMIFKGTIDCSTNPNYPAADRGWVYKISVAGRIGGASGPVVEVNDTIICGTDNTVAGTHAAVGSNWNILQTNIVDASILVTGPGSATSGNFVLFNGTTGKILQDSGFDPSTVVRTVGDQSIAGVKTFDDKEGAAGGLRVGSSDINSYLQLVSQTDTGGALNLTRLIANPPEGGGTFDILLPNGSGVLARLEDITTTNITGILAESKGGTGQSSYAVGDLLYGNTSNTLAKLTSVATGNVLLAGGVTSAPLWGKVGLTTHVSGTLPVANGGTNQTSYTNGQLLIGNTVDGNTLTKATLTSGTAIAITNGAGSITIGHGITSSLSGPQGSGGIASITVDALGHVTAVTSATYLTGATVCAAIVDCPIDGGTF